MHHHGRTSKLWNLGVEVNKQWYSRGRAYFSSNPGIEKREEDGEVGPTSSCIIEEKDFLRQSPNSGIYILDLIDNGALEPDPSFYNKILRRCTQLGKLHEGRIVHSHFSRSRFHPNTVVLNTILNMYAKLNSLDEARMLFDEMPERDLVSWTALITGYSQNNRPEDGLFLFPEMIRSGVRPNEFTFSSLLKAAGAVSSERNGRQVHGLAYRYGFHMNVYVGSSLVDMYARFGLMGEAKLAFDNLIIKNEVSWNALIAAHTRREEGEDAIKLFVEMQREKMRPTPFTYSSILSASASSGALEQGKWVHANIIKSGEKLVSFVGNTLLDMYAKSGSIEDARKVFSRLVRREKDVVSWNSMLSACAQHGLGEETIEKFEEMVKIGISPNGVTFLCVLTACSHAGLIGKGIYYFDLMEKYNIERDVSHYVTMVDLFGRGGELDRAKVFIENMPIEPTAAVWGALLGACRIYKNIKMGSLAAEHLFKLDKSDSGPHVILYNMYASMGRWNEAARVRKMMRESGVKKEPACSWVEIGNLVHMFVANDDAHPMREKIFEKWEEINRKIKDIGYFPDSSQMVLFADRDEREAKLQYHSEKIALAFAIISTPRGSVIRIKKNIRVCGDCHSAFKFVSNAEEREIVLRDKNRFHHFSNGVCSCGDYW